MKVSKEVLEYLHAHNCATIGEFVARQDELNNMICAKVRGYLIFGLTL